MNIQVLGRCGCSIIKGGRRNENGVASGHIIKRIIKGIYINNSNWWFLDIEVSRTVVERAHFHIISQENNNNLLKK